MGNTKMKEAREMEYDRQNSYARLMAKYNRDLMSYIFTLHPYRSEVDDIIQETAIKIFKNFDKYDAERPFLPWAFRFASYEVLKFRRSKARCKLIFTDEIVDQMIDERTNYQSDIEQKRTVLESCIKKLKDDDLDLIHWRYRAGQTVKQVADKLHIPAKRLYKRLERLRLILHKCVLSSQ